MTARVSAAAALVAILWLGAIRPAVTWAQAGGPPIVSGVDLVAPFPVPEMLVRSAIGSMDGRPRSRIAVRESIERLWSLGLYADIRVDEVEAPGGIRLRYHLTPRPLVRRILWEGDPGVDLARVATAAGLAIGEDASPARLASARENLLALYRGDGFLDARVDVRATPVPDEAAADVSVVLAAGSPARVGHVRFEGSLGLAASSVTQAFGLDRGDRYSDRLASERARALEQRLRREGFFEARVRVRPLARSPGTPDVDLVVDVAAGRRYAVTFAGRHAIPEPVLRERLTLLDSGTVDEFDVQASARQIEAAYRERGHASVQVTGSIEDAADPPTVRFDVTEGPVVRVTSVAFRGNTALSTARLRAAMATRPAATLQPGLFRRDVLDRDVATLQALARAEGFADAIVGPPEIRLEDGMTRAHVLIPIQEGPRVRVAAVSVDGQTLVDAAELLASVPVAAGDPWAPSRIQEGQRNLEGLYARLGYHGATVDPSVTRRGDEVSVVYHIREGLQTRIGRVLLRGLLLTREETVRRQLGFEPGDVYIPDRLVAARHRLERPAAFATVDVGPARPPPAPFADVEVTLTEQKPWRLELGLGYDTAEGFRGDVALSHDNLSGTARGAGVRVREAIGGEAIRRLDHVEIFYREPWIPGTDWQGQAQVYAERSENLGYDLARVGFLAWVGDDLLSLRTAQAFRSQLRYRLEAARVSNVSPDLVAEGVTPGNERIASLTPVVVWDVRDDAVNPRRGSVHRASLELAYVGFGGTVDFVKAEASTSWFVPWPPPTVLAVSGRLGLAAPFGGTSSLPIEDRFFVGGSTSIRGYPENRVGPRDAAGNPIGGNALAVLSVEWRFPLWRWIGGAVFADAGTVTPEVGDLSLSEFRSGVGAGLRVATPVGPIRLDVGYALRPISGEDRLQVYLTVGFPF